MRRILADKRLGFVATRVCREACSHGHVDLLRFLVKRCKVDLTMVAENLFFAAVHGHLEVLQWARKVGVEFPPEVFDALVTYRQMDAIRWYLQASGLPEPVDVELVRFRGFPRRTLAFAAAKLDLPILAAYTAMRGSWTQSDVNLACLNDSFNVLACTRRGDGYRRANP